MMNELSDRLEELKSEMKFGDGMGGGCVVCRPEVLANVKSICFANLDAIIKALRFAADMERLEIDRIIAPKYTGDVWTIFHMKANRQLMTECSDIYTAASKAVEELEKGD